MNEQDLLQIVARLRKLEAKGREVKNEIDGIRALLREEFQARGVTEVQAGRYRVRQTEYERNTFDGKAFREEHPKQYAMYCRLQPCSRIEVLG